MKIVILLIFTLSSIFSYSQKKNKNEIDYGNLKQDFRIEYDSIDVEGFIDFEQRLPDSIGNSDRQTYTVTKYEQIKHVGKYKKGKKDGTWRVYKPHDVLWMKIIYNNEQRSKIEIFYNNGNILYSIKKKDNDNYLIKEFSKSGLLTKKQYKKAEFVNSIDEVKLFILGY